MKTTRSCMECGGRRFAPTKEPDQHVISGTRYRVDVPALKCRDCGDVTIEGTALERAESLIGAEVGRRGPANGETLRFMRRVLGIKSGDLAALLGIRPETLSRWERHPDRAPERSAWATVAAMVTEACEGRQATRDRLEALQRGGKPPKTVHIESSLI